MSANEQIERKLSIPAQSDVYIYLYSYLFRDSRNTNYLQTILMGWSSSYSIFFILLFWKHFQLHTVIIVYQNIIHTVCVELEIEQYCICGTYFPTSMYFCVLSSTLDVVTPGLPHCDFASDTKLMVSMTAFTYYNMHKFRNI